AGAAWPQTGRAAFIFLKLSARNSSGRLAEPRLRRCVLRIVTCVAVARRKAMADWKRLTSPSGDRVYLNLDVMIGMQRNPDINITFLQTIADPRVNIEVRETPDEILSET